MKNKLFTGALLGAAYLFSAQMAWAAPDQIVVNGQALSKWKEAESDHFKIYSDGDEKYLTKLSGRLEAIHYLLKIATGLKEPAEANVVKVKVFAVADLAKVRSLIGAPQSDVAGYYDPQLSGPISVIPRNAGSDGSFSGELVLFHEYTHHFMLQYQAAAYPAWYVEGFAEIASTASFERPGAITFGKAAKHREAELRYSKHYPAAKMLDGRFLKEKRGAEGWEYGDAWALSHYLTFSEKRRGQLGAYLKAINAGQPYAEAAKVFGDLNDLTREVNIYIEGGSFPYKAPPLPPEVIKAPDIRPLTLAEAEFIDDNIVMERFAQISTKEEYEAAAKVREKAGNPLKKDFDTYFKEESTAREKWMQGLNGRVTRFAGDPSAWNVKAHAECMAKDFAACQTSAERALALKPGDWEAQLRKGQALIGIAKTGPEAGRAAAASDGRKWVLKANASNPAAHEPLLYYFESFAAEGKGAPADAVDSLMQVVNTIPQVDGPRLELGSALIARKQYALARKTLRPLAYSPHETTEQAAAQALLDVIDTLTNDAKPEETKAGGS
jgi:hypothetical protein